MGRSSSTALKTLRSRIVVKPIAVIHELIRYLAAGSPISFGELTNQVAGIFHRRWQSHSKSFLTFIVSQGRNEAVPALYFWFIKLYSGWTMKILILDLYCVKFSAKSSSAKCFVLIFLLLYYMLVWNNCTNKWQHSINSRLWKMWR